MPIRKANEKDASRLAEILIFAKRAAYRPIFREDNVSFGEMQVLPLALSFLKDGALEGIWVEGDAFAKGMLRALPPEGGRQQLAELYVDPFFQGEGVGGKLMHFFLESAEGSFLFLWVLEKNAAARAFYEKWGFYPMGAARLAEGTRERELLHGRPANQSEKGGRQP